MALQSSFYNTDGTTRTYPSTKHIATKQHVSVYGKRVSDSTWVILAVDLYELVNNSIVFDTAPDTVIYSQIEVRVADTAIELEDSPSDIATVAGAIANVINVSNNMSVVDNVNDNIGAITTVSANTTKLNSIVDDVLPNLSEILLADDNAAIATGKAIEASASAKLAQEYAESIAPSSLVKNVETIAALRTTTYLGQTIVTVAGYYTALDNIGTRDYYWDATSTEADNGGTIIKVTGVTTGRWKMKYSGSIDPKWFGYSDLSGDYNKYGGFCNGVTFAFDNDEVIYDLPQKLNRYTIGQDRKIYDELGNKFTIKGVSLYDYLFVSSEARDTWNIRQRSDGAGGYLYNVPTGYSTTQFVNPSQVENMIVRAQQDGCNTIRVGVDPAILTTPAQAHPTTGVWYPSELSMLDTIIYYATKYNLVVILRQGRKDATASQFSEFMSTLIKRYKKYQNVWFNPENEINAGATDGAEWKADMETYFSSMRGAGCTTPIIIQTMDYGGQSSWVESIKLIDSSATLSHDFGLVLGLHVYQQASELTGFIGTARYRQQEQRIPFAYNKYCMFIDEIGMNNNITGFYDPSLGNASGDSSIFDTNATKEWMREYLVWVSAQVYKGNMCGAIATTYAAYVIGTDSYDKNTMRKYGRTGDSYELTAWGDIFINYFLKSNNNLFENVSEVRFAYKYSFLRLIKDNGAGVLNINRRSEIVPYVSDSTDPIKIDLTGLIDDTNYGVYAFVDSAETVCKIKLAVFDLSVSENKPIQDPLTGMMIKPMISTITTDPSGYRYDDVPYTFVGMFRLAGGAVLDTSTQRLVRSWSNEPYLKLEDTISIDTTPDVSNLLAGLSIEALMFPDERINIKMASKFTPTTTGAVVVRILENTILVNPEYTQYSTGSQNGFCPLEITSYGNYDFKSFTVYASGGGTTTFKSGGRLIGDIRK